MSSNLSRSRQLQAAGALAAVAALALAGCGSKSSSDNSSASSSGGASMSSSDTASSNSTDTSSASSDSSGNQQQAQTTDSTKCTYSQYGAPKLDLKNVTVGFSQSETTSNPFRNAETKSITDQAKTLGIKLIQRNANANVQQQNTDIMSMIAQGAKVLIVAPENSDGLKQSLTQAKAKHIPVLTIDRTVTGTACKDFIGFIGSDFTGQAKIAADDLGQALGGKGKVAVLQGTSGNNVAQERTDGFTTEMKAKYPNIQVVASQTANFDQTKGQQVMAQILQAHPDITGVYTENDPMGLGAIQAIKSAGKTPGKDIKLVSIDGVREIVQDVVSGLVVADVETNPRFGPLAFQALNDFYGQGTSTKVIIKDHHFTKANAASALKNGQVY